MSLEIDLAEPLEAYVREKVSSGQFGSTNEVLGEAVRLLKEREELARNDLRGKIEEGLASARAGRLIPSEEVWAEVDAIIADSENTAR